MQTTMLNVGDKVPELTALLYDGGEFSTEKLSGKPYVIYFYPKDFTPGCTKEACIFPDQRADVTEAGAELFAVSLGGLQEHKAFAESHRAELSADSRPRPEGFGRVSRPPAVGNPANCQARHLRGRRSGRGAQRNRSEFNIDKHIEQAIATLRSIRSTSRAQSSGQ
jgi:AhpC/TSA family protein